MLTWSLINFCAAQNNQLSFGSLRPKIESILKQYNAVVGISVTHLETNETFSINDKIKFPMQSVYKFPLALAILNQVEQGNLSLQKIVEVKKEMHSFYNWSPLKKIHPEELIKISIEELLYFVISKSDNLACDVLFNIMKGTKNVNSYIHQLGFKEIEIAYTEKEMYKNPSLMYKNYCRPATMNAILKSFFEGKLLNPTNTKFLMHLMIESENSFARLKGNLAPETIVAHKTGTGDSKEMINACNDVGIINLPNGKHVAMSVFVMNSKETYETTESIIAQISEEVYSLFCENKMQVNDKIAYGNNSNAGHYLMLNGAKHYYETYGSGKPLLLIHGNLTPTKGWAPQIAYFSKKYQVYSIDCRGRGKTELGNDSLTYMQITKDVAEFIKIMKLDSVNIVGKSDGGIIGILLGIYFPEHIKKIVAFGANMEPDTNSLFPATVYEMHEERVKADKMLSINDTTQNWLLEQQRYRMMEYQPHISVQDLQRINVPVLVMSTDRDLIKEEHTFFIYKNISKANLCILPNEKHGIAKLNPDLFNSTVDKYLSEPYYGNDYRFK